MRKNVIINSLQSLPEPAACFPWSYNYLIDNDFTHCVYDFYKYVNSLSFKLVGLRGYRKMNDGGYKSDLSINERVMIAIVRAAELFRKENDSLFKNYGLTFPQYNVLRVLDASSNGQNTLTSIGRIMLVSGANMTGIAKRLEKKGFLIRKSDPNDERIKLLEITPKGKQTLKNISPVKDENLKSFLVSFSDDEKAHMLAGLKRILKKETHSS